MSNLFGSASTVVWTGSDYEVVWIYATAEQGTAALGAAHIERTGRVTKRAVIGTPTEAIGAEVGPGAADTDTNR